MDKTDKRSVCKCKRHSSVDFCNYILKESCVGKLVLLHDEKERLKSSERHVNRVIVRNRKIILIELNFRMEQLSRAYH